MKAPREIAEKVKEYEKLAQEAEVLLNDVVGWFNNNGADGVCILKVFSSDKPQGKLQDDGEYCNQSLVGDSFQGSYYHPVDGTEDYIGYWYWC